jgi:hypothetical protein
MELKDIIRIYVEMVLDIAEHKAIDEISKEDIIQQIIEALKAI